MATTTKLEKERGENWSELYMSLDRIRHCSRCGGLMVAEYVIDLPGHRCVQCGEVVDPVILHNRQRGAGIGMS